MCSKFKFYQPQQARTWLAPSWSARVSDETLTFHSDPFFAECRAYGRISEYQKKKTRGKTPYHPKGIQGREQHWTTKEIAVPCYGYIALPAERYEDMLHKRFGITAWNRAEEDDKRTKDKRQPFRALVKRLVDSDSTVVHPGKMLRDLKKLRGIGIFPRDVYARNYKAGLLVDFSIAWTEPHWFLSLMKGAQLMMRKDNELFLFDEMIEAAGIKTNVRAAPNPEYIKKLRSNASPPDSEEDDDDEND